MLLQQPGQPPLDHVIITGGSSGIGEAFARVYLARGCRVSLIARREEGLYTAKARLHDGGRLGERIAVFSADVADAARLDETIGQAEGRFGPCDLLIASAGIAEPGYFEALSPDAFRRQIDVNLLGVVNAARSVYCGMVRRRSGTILIVSSAAAFLGIFGYTAYGASKFAVSGFAEALRAEAKRHGVRVAICFPADTETPQLAFEEKLKPPETKAITGAIEPMDADDLARRVVRKLDAGRFAIYPNIRVALLARFGRVLQPAVHLWLDRTVGRAARSAERHDRRR